MFLCICQPFCRCSYYVPDFSQFLSVFLLSYYVASCSSQPCLSSIGKFVPKFVLIFSLHFVVVLSATSGSGCQSKLTYISAFFVTCMY